jgi:hypothetical protein
MLTSKEMEEVEDLIELLDVFHYTTTLMSAQKYVTCSIILPAVTRILEILIIFRSKYKFFFLHI